VKPDRKFKLILATAALIAAAASAGSRPAIGLDDQGERSMQEPSILKQSPLRTRS
jgi:hypothetical protein